MRRPPPRLAMVLLVRDEVDIIGANLRFHAAQGVDHFLVMDNGSVDGSRELLHQLQDELDLQIVDNPQHTMDQDLWMSRLVARVRAEKSADWVIPNDADEFWLSRDGDLKAEMSASATLVQVPRQNMLPRREEVDQPGYRFFSNRLRVAAPLGPATPQLDPARPLDVDMMLRTLPGKVMCRVSEVVALGMGNHAATTSRDATVPAGQTLIYHYPIRSYEQFVSKVRNFGSALAANTRLDATSCWHVRRWYSQLLRGRLHDEYLRLLPDSCRAGELLRQGVLREDGAVADHFSNSDPA